MYPADEQALGLAVEYVYGSAVPGDVAEFGCLTGRTAAVLAREMARLEAGWGLGSDRQHGIGGRSLWLFDSFDGFPDTTNEIDAAAPHVKAGVWRPHDMGGGNNGSPEAVRNACVAYLPRQRVNVVPGWFKDTLTLIPDGRKFAVVHMDCDLYTSTLEVLNFLLGHKVLSDGAMILFDDWGCNRWSLKFGQQKAWADAWSVERHHMSFSSLGPYGVVGWRFVVHRDD